MLSSWIVPLAILVVFAAVLLVPLAEVLLSRVERRSFHCPWVDSKVSVQFVKRTAFAIIDPLDVRSCSAFEDPDHPTCGKGCLQRVTVS